MPFRPTHGKTLSQGFELENGYLGIEKPALAVQSAPDATSVVESKINGSA